MSNVKYDLKKSKDEIGVLYPRIVDKEDREIDGFHRVSADEDWPTLRLDHIDTDVKYWTARITANTHRRGVSEKERKKDIIELAKSLRAEGHKGSLVNIIARLTTFKVRYLQRLLPIGFKQKEKAVRSGMKADALSASNEQTPKRKSKHETSDKEKLDNLYKKIEKSAFNGQKPTSQSTIEKATTLGLDVTQYKEKLEEIKQALTNSIAKQYSEVKKDLKVAYEKSTAIKKVLTAQIKAEETRIEKSNKDLRESLRDEVTEEVTQQVIERTEKERLEKSSEKNVHVANATGETEWYTPKIYIDAAKKVMGTIDVDPASTEIANKIVNAEKYYSIKDDGRLQKWDGNVWMNPPYSQPLVTEFCNLLVEKIKKGEIKQACVLVNNATETLFYQNMLSCCQAVCFIKGRVKFIDKKGKSTGVPLQGQTILYFGEYEKPFGEIFSEFGRVLYATS